MYTVTEPEAELSDSSEGSDEIINLSSLSDSEPEDGPIPKEDLNNKVFEETHLGNNSLKVHTCRTFTYIYEYLSPGVFYWIKFTAGYNKSTETGGIHVPYMNLFILKWQM